MLNRLRVLRRSLGAIGPRATLQLAWRSLRAAQGEGPEARYRISVPGFKRPVLIRGGNSSDGFALYQHLVMKDLEVLGDLGTPRFAIDAGANIGAASLYLLRRYPSLRVIAVEPDPDTFAICSENLAQFGDRARLVQGAVWGSRCELSFVRSDVEWNSHVAGDAGAGSGPEQPGSRTVQVPAYDIPSLLEMAGADGVDLLKIDVEGSEANVFSVQPDRWLPKVRNIIIELHGEPCERAFHGALEAYECEKSDFRTVVVCRNLKPRNAASA
jgi:FkbM family methyltransferase